MSVKLTVDMDKIGNIMSVPWRANTDDFKYCNVLSGNTPRTIAINESQPIHMLQILYILKERSWQYDEWVEFTEKQLTEWVVGEYNIYLENDEVFGSDFVKQFPLMVKRFISEYCKIL